MTLHDLGYHNNVCLLASYKDIRLTRCLLIHALEYSIRQHPALSVQVTSSEIAKPYFIKLKSINLDEVIEYVDVPEVGDEQHAWIDDFLSVQHSIGFHDKKKPLWRVVVLNHRYEDVKVQETLIGAVDIAFIWHHVIGDGKSGLAVHKSILEGFTSTVCASSYSYLFRRSEASQEDGGACSPSIIIEPPLNELFPSLEQIFTMPASRSTIFNKWLNGVFGSCLPLHLRSRRNLNAKRWSGAPYHDETPIKTLIRHITIPASTTSALAKLCRMRGTTITAFLQAFIGRTISRHYDHMCRLRCATAISMRRFMESDLHIGEQEMGLWVSAFHFELDARELSDTYKKKKRFWELARRNRKRISCEIAKRDTDLGIGGLRFIPDFRQNLKAKIGRKRDDSFAVTNLGVFDGRLMVNGSYGKMDERPRIEKMIFSQSCHVNGSALQFCIMSMMDGQMVICVSWQEGTVPVKDTECIATVLKAELIKIVEE